MIFGEINKCSLCKSKKDSCNYIAESEDFCKKFIMDNQKVKHVVKKNMRNCYREQIEFQTILTGQNLPNDNRQDFRDQICLMTEELGELAKTDKRWRKERTNSSGNKIEELADVFIVAMNLAIFSGYSYEEIVKEIEKKQKENAKRLLK